MANRCRQPGRTQGSPLHSLTRSLPWLVLAALVIGLLIGFPLLALLPLAIYAVDLAIRRAQQPAAAFALWALRWSAWSALAPRSSTSVMASRVPRRA